MGGFIVCVFIVLSIFCGVLWLFSVLARLGFGLWMFVLNLGLLGLFASAANESGANGGLTACAYLFIAGIINLVMISAHRQISTKEGREEMLRQIEAQKEYDRKNRNFVQEAKDKKGTIEYTEKKR